MSTKIIRQSYIRYTQNVNENVFSLIGSEINAKNRKTNFARNLDLIKKCVEKVYGNVFEYQNKVRAIKINC